MRRSERKEIPNPLTHGHVWQREIIVAARRLTRLQRSRRDTARRLKQLDDEIRLAKRELKAIAGAAFDSDLFDLAPPLRIFGESQG